MSKIIRVNDQVKTVRFNPISREPKPGRDSSGESPSFGQDSKKATEEALSKAELIVKEAQERARQIESEAYQKGYQEGLEVARAETSGRIELLTSMASQAMEEKWRIINSHEEDIVNLALEIAEKVIGESIDIKPGIVLNNTRKALLIAAEREHILIRVNPEDADLIKAHKEDLMTLMDGIQKIEVIADRRVARGGCVLETSAGNVDARIQSQLCHIDQALRGVISGNEVRD